MPNAFRIDEQTMQVRHFPRMIAIKSENSGRSKAIRTKYLIRLCLRFLCLVLPVPPAEKSQLPPDFHRNETPHGRSMSAPRSVKAAASPSPASQAQGYKEDFSQGVPEATIASDWRDQDCARLRDRSHSSLKHGGVTRQTTCTGKLPEEAKAKTEQEASCSVLSVATRIAPKEWSPQGGGKPASS
jgi:hypothetical protein